MIKKVVVLISLLFLFFLSCSGDSDSLSSNNSNSVWEQKSQMLTNWADNFIVPNYQNLSNSLDQLQLSINSFVTNPNQSTLDEVRGEWLESYKLWQHVEMFNIGPAEQTFYHLKMNVFPTSVTNIESVILSEDFSNLNNAPFYSAQGFPALDYLLYGIAENDNLILSLYSTNQKYSNYLVEVIERMVSSTDYVLTEWTNFRSGFISSVENTATSSANKMTNDFIYYYEKGFRANKFGIPVGVFSGGNVFPEKVEAYYNKNVSQVLALEALDAIKLFFNGNGSYSLSQYIDNFATDDMENLSNDINSQFDLSRNSIEGLDSNFVNQLNSNSLQMGITYDVIQAGTVLLKTDMLSVLQIATDYVDADGD